MQRATVYRHFPDDARPVRARARRTRIGAHPYPAPDAWAAIRDPDAAHPARRSASCTRYYRTVEPMLANVRRDAQLLPELAGGDGAQAYFEAVEEILAGRLARGDAARRRAALAVAVDFADVADAAAAAAGRRRGRGR